jgi:eukaryotic-like serine/threonine-protein kinase
VLGVQFSRDGRQVLTRTVKAAQVWDTATGRPLSPPLMQQGPLATACFSPDGKTVLTASQDKTARIWELPVPLQGPRDQIVLWTKVSTGMAIGNDGLVRVMDFGAWRENYELLEKFGSAISGRQ